MANITQTIPALTAGISQQPDEQKIPGTGERHGERLT